MAGLLIKCHAKVNLALAVLGRDESAGMHYIDSIVAKISLADKLTLECCGDGFTTEFTFAPGVRSEHIDPLANTITRAHAAVEKVLGITLPPLTVRVEKHIPVGGGLGGGSSDAAGFIFGLKQLATMGLLGDAGKAVKKASESEWHQAAQAIGMDTHIFLSPHGVMRVQGFGEIITPVELPGLEKFCCAVVDPGVSLSTREMYAKVQAYSGQSHVDDFMREWRALAPAKKRFPHRIHEPKECAAFPTTPQKRLVGALQFAKNDFTDIAREASSEVAAALDKYAEKFPLVAVTGSGSCVLIVGDAGNIREAGLAPYSFLIEPAVPA
jgi:4-diphosphocytidyl-2C-methyl-D-erythritol kinase